MILIKVTRQYQSAVLDPYIDAQNNDFFSEWHHYSAL